MILKAEKIADLLSNPDEQDPFVITPQPDLKTVRESGSASIDLRLGTWFTLLRHSRTEALQLGKPPSTETYYTPFGRDYVLHPGYFVLAITLEWVRFPKDLAGYVIGRSSWGRCGLIIATATGVHPGFTGCLTLELTNVGRVPIKIKPGMTICQVFLHKVETSTAATDVTSFAARRKPWIGKIELDDVAKRLSSTT